MEETYRDWEIRYSVYAHTKEDTFVATSPDYNASYEGPEDGGWCVDGNRFTAATVEELKKMIDEHIEENE